MFGVIVDAGACPQACLNILRKHKSSWGYELLTVSSIDHVIDHSHHITVGKGPDAADLAVINNTQRGDIVVTQDWGLAALALGKGAFAISPSGRVYSNQNIDFLLEERSIKARYRRAGGRTKGPSARKTQDDRRFEDNLLVLLERAKRNLQKVRKQEFYMRVQPCVLVIFGATGDLTQRKLYPALYNLWREELLPPHFAVVSIGRRDKTTDEVRDDITAAIRSFHGTTILHLST